MKRLQNLYDNEVGVGSGGNIDGIDNVGGVSDGYMLMVFYKNKHFWYCRLFLIYKFASSTN